MKIVIIRCNDEGDVQDCYNFLGTINQMGKMINAFVEHPDTDIRVIVKATNEQFFGVSGAEKFLEGLTIQ